MNRLLPILLVLMLAGNANGQVTPGDTAKQQRWNLHSQITYIYQYKPEFNAAYTGPHSLLPEEEHQNSLTGTLFFGLRLWKGAEVYVNPEIAGGSGLSGAFGLGASTNGETFRVGNPAPTLYLARAYFKQTFALGSGTYVSDDLPNQLQVKMPDQYLQFVVGKYCLADFFDNNLYSCSPRLQFMNWALMNNPSWDYAANVRGYNCAFTTILQLKDWSAKASIGLLPTVANGPDLNWNLNESYAVNAEVGRAYKINKKQGNIRLLGFYNFGKFGAYKNAISIIDSLGMPDITAAEKPGKFKIGVGVSADQQLSETVGIFARAGWNNGKTETWCYTEVDKTLSVGLSIMGKKWKRPSDNFGIALVGNGLSEDHHNYLAAGGLGFELGDGNLNYSNEGAAELFYSFRPANMNLWITGDYQFVVNPGYNKDRGPVSVFSVRVHFEL